MNRCAVGRALLSLLLVPLAVSAGSFIVPADRDLIDAADAIAVVTIRSHHSYFDSGGLILTDYVASVSEAAKGDLVSGGSVVITEIGGAVGDRGLISSTAPRFVDGQRALVLLDRMGERWSTLSGQLGKFDFVRDASSATFLVRGATDSEIFGWDVLGNEHVERLRGAEAFLEYVSSVARGEEAPEDYFREAAGPVAPEPVGPESDQFVEPASTFPGNAFLLQFGFSPPGGARWESGSFTMATSGSQSGSGAAASGGAGVWTDDSTSSISIGISGSVSGINYGDSGGNGTNVLNFGVPATYTTTIAGESKTPLSGNVVGQALLWASSARHSFGGEDYYTSGECDIIIKDTLSSTVLNEVVAHEIGHCLGFRHSVEGPGEAPVPDPKSTVALMYWSASGRGAILQDWDREAANEVYGDGTFGVTQCTPAAITQQPQGATINQGQSRTLSVAASGTAPLSYQWLLNNAAIAGATDSSHTTGALNAGSYSYTVRVSNSCNTAGVTSAAAVVTVLCTQPTIVAHPLSFTIPSGQSATLSVSTIGATSFQWFRGASGNESQPIIGATGSIFPTGALTATSSFWVRVTNSCGSVNSNTATVSVTTTQPPPSRSRRRPVGRG